MLNLINITNGDVQRALADAIKTAAAGSPSWRVLNSALELTTFYSFTDTRTYPRPDHPDPLKRKPLIFMLVGILVSLRTTLENEQRAMASLMLRFPTVERLQKASATAIAHSIHQAGMAERRARLIRSALDYIKDHLDGSLERLAEVPMDDARVELLKIPGIGPKAADCLLSIGLGKPSIAVDVNVFRVTSWLFALPWSEAPEYRNRRQVAMVKEILDAAVPKDAFLCQIVHTMFLLHGKASGPRHPAPGQCAIGDYCISCDQRMKLPVSETQPKKRLASK